MVTEYTAEEVAALQNEYDVQIVEPPQVPQVQAPAVEAPQGYGFGDQLMNSMLLGGGSKANAAIQAGTTKLLDALGYSDTGKSFGDLYDIYKQMRLKDKAQYEAAKPTEALLADLTGSFAVPMGPVAGTVSKIAGKVPLLAKTLSTGQKTPGLIARALGQGTEGAVYGGAAGALSSEGSYDRMIEDALQGASWGSAIGAGTEGLVGGARKGWDWLADPVKSGEASQIIEDLAAATASKTKAFKPDVVGLETSIKTAADTGSPLIPSIERENTKLMADLPLSDKRALAIESDLKRLASNEGKEVGAMQRKMQETVGNANTKDVIDEIIKPVRLEHGTSYVQERAGEILEGGTRVTQTGAKRMDEDTAKWYQDLLALSKFKKTKDLPGEVPYYNLFDLKDRAQKLLATSRDANPIVAKGLERIDSFLQANLTPAKYAKAQDMWAKTTALGDKYLSGSVGKASAKDHGRLKITDWETLKKTFMADTSKTKQFVRALPKQDLQLAQELELGSLLKKDRKEWVKYLNDNRESLRTLFGDRFPQLETAISKHGENLTSWLAQRQVPIMSYLARVGGALGVGAMLGGGATGSTLGAMAGAGLALPISSAVYRQFAKREAIMGTVFSKILDDPKLRDLIKKEATEANIREFNKRAKEIRWGDIFSKKGYEQGIENLKTQATKNASQKAVQQSSIYMGRSMAESRNKNIEELSKDTDPYNTRAERENALPDVSTRAEEVMPRDELVSAVINAESAGKANAVSSKGAQGLMQLMPETGKWLFDKYGKGKWDKYDPYNEEQNVFLGSKYLDDLISQFGDERIALAAYNWGPGNVKKKLREGDTFEDLYADLPAETRKYIGSITKALG